MKAAELGVRFILKRQPAVVSRRLIRNARTGDAESVLCPYLL